MRMFLKIASIFLLLQFTMSLSAQNDVVGQLSYVKGNIELTRSGKVISASAVKIGMEIHDFDQIKVDKSAQAEVSLDNKKGIKASLKISESTIVKIDISSIKEGQKGGIELLKGNIDLKVAKMSGGNGLNVRTNTTVAGVRGTTFSVSVGPNDEVLIACEEGRVACTTDDDAEYYSEPGNVVESNGDSTLVNTPVKVSDLATYKNKWFSQKIEAFKANPTKALKQMATRYLKFKSAFEQAYTNLMKNRDVVKKWMDQDEKGNTGSKIDQLKEKKLLVGPILKARGALFYLEHAYYRITQIDELFEGQKIDGSLDDGSKLSDFMKKFQAESGSIVTKINDINYVLKLYKKRNDGTFPLGGDSIENF